MSSYPYMVCWPAVRFPWVTDEDGDEQPDERQDHDMWFGPFATYKEAMAFARKLKPSDYHNGYEVGMIYPPDHDFARWATSLQARNRNLGSDQN